MFNTLPTPLGGIPVVISNDVPEFITQWDPGPRPRSKKRRVRKKWEKKYGKHERVRALFMIGDSVLGEPLNVAMLKGFTLPGDE